MKKNKILTIAGEKNKRKNRLYILGAIGAITVVSFVFCMYYNIIVHHEFFTTDNYTEALSAFIVLFLMYLTLFIYEKYISKSFEESLKPYFISLFTSFLTLVLSVTLMKYVSEFFIPFVFLFLVLSALTNTRTSMFCLFVTLLALSFVVINGNGVYNVTKALYGGLFGAVGGALAVFSVKKSYKRINIVLYNMFLGFISSAFAALYAFLSGAFPIGDAVWMFTSTALSVALFMILIPLLEKSFDISTDFRLSEYLTLKNPVLRELKEKAPGTYHHSLMVATLAEICAEAIGENPMLARAGAYYHDVGKIKAPEFFGENQTDGYNPHDELIPEISASKIIAHTKNGVQILKDNGFPKEIIRVAEEHHGTTPVNFFYNKAKNMTEGSLASYNYVYENDKPSNKISALIMICDTVESAVRANQSADLADLIKKLIKDKMNLEQFDSCDISLKDIETIQKTLAEVIPQVFHARIRYQATKE
ncbi:MAG: HDIG domain-containing protein [Clostridiales bacterium]|jgi:putative nucleotidyltransferase with HDIG domain|nr:HDIG domain-containing protein [Clostridiales bacterium]